MIKIQIMLRLSISIPSLIPRIRNLDLQSFLRIALMFTITIPLFGPLVNCVRSWTILQSISSDLLC